ncbi:MAG: hypothetical protein AABN33_00015 [Acidobacteriota bacterium]
MREEAARAGELIYEQHIKSLVEPTHDGEVVAIHIPSRDFFLGNSLIEVSDRLRQKYPHAGRGEVYSRGVGKRIVIRARTPRVTGTRR